MWSLFRKTINILLGVLQDWFISHPLSYLLCVIQFWVFVLLHTFFSPVLWSCTQRLLSAMKIPSFVQNGDFLLPCMKYSNFNLFIDFFKNETEMASFFTMLPVTLITYVYYTCACSNLLTTLPEKKPHSF